MKLLVIGGTQFVGRHFVEAAVARGDEVTTFNRGRTRAEPMPGVTALIGDRRQDLSALAAGRWDAVVDACGYLPGEVARMADCLHGRVGRYLFVSSVSAYASFAEPNDEASPLGRIDDTDTEVVDGRTYGPLKALCEAELTRRFGEAALLVRPGLVVGPYDPTQRFTYWPARVACATDGEAVLVPGTPDDPVQFIDARDLAHSMLQLLDGGRAGAFNIVSAPGRWRRADLMSACAAAAGVQPRWVYADEGDIERLGLKGWSDLPLWMAPTGEWQSFMAQRADRASAAGLSVRPLAQTVADTLDWWRGLPAEARHFTKAGLSAEREAEALRALGR